MIGYIAYLETQRQMRDQFTYPVAVEREVTPRETPMRRAIAMLLVAFAHRAEATAHDLAPQQTRSVVSERRAVLAFTNAPWRYTSREQRGEPC